LTWVFSIIDGILDHTQSLTGVTASKRFDETFNAFIPAQTKRGCDVSHGDQHGI
jgi:hypothetical protein